MHEKMMIDDSVIQRCQDADNWYGSHYELALAYGQQSLNLQQRLALLRVVWETPSFLGVVNHPSAFGQAWKEVDDPLANTPYKQRYGCLRLANGHVIGCGSSFLQVVDDTWFVIFIPLGMLSFAYPVTYTRPITHQGNPWTIKVDEILARLGARIYEVIPFQLGVLGEEASSRPLRKQLASLADDPGFLVPASLFEQQNVIAHGLPSPGELWWTGGKKGGRWEQWYRDTNNERTD